MKEIIIKVPDDYVIDEENSSFTCIKFKKKEVICWEDLEEIKGYFVTDLSFIHEGSGTTRNGKNRNIFATEEQAEACIALAMLSQLMKDVNIDWIPDWNNTSQKNIQYLFLLLR